MSQKEPAMWGRLTAKGDKAELQRRREASIEVAHERMRQADAALAASRKRAAL